MHRTWPYIWWITCQTYRRYVHCIYMVLPTLATNEYSTHLTICQHQNTPTHNISSWKSIVHTHLEEHCTNTLYTLLEEHRTHTLYTQCSWKSIVHPPMTWAPGRALYTMPTLVRPWESLPPVPLRTKMGVKAYGVTFNYLCTHRLLSHCAQKWV